MKTRYFGAIAFALLMTAPAFARGRVVLKCSNGEETQLKIVQVGQGDFRADVTEQSVGDSYPTFHFRNLEQEPRPAHVMGAPLVYRGREITITVQVDGPGMHALIDAPSIGLDNESVSCGR